MSNYSAYFTRLLSKLMAKNVHIAMSCIFGMGYIHVVLMTLSSRSHYDYVYNLIPSLIFCDSLMSDHSRQQSLQWEAYFSLPATGDRAESIVDNLLYMGCIKVSFLCIKGGPEEVSKS